MGSKAGDVWRLVVPVLPCSGSSSRPHRYGALVRNRPLKLPAAASPADGSPPPCWDRGRTGRAALELLPGRRRSASPPCSTTTLQQVREAISAVGERVSYVEEQMEHIKAALPDLDSKIRYASLGMPLSSLSLEEMQHLKGIHFKLLQFWEELSRKLLEKLAGLADCLQELEDQAASAPSNLGGEESVSDFEKPVGAKGESDLRSPNQELEQELYLDRVCSAPGPRKSTLPLADQPPPQRGACIQRC